MVTVTASASVSPVTAGLLLLDGEAGAMTLFVGAAGGTVSFVSRTAEDPGDSLPLPFVNDPTTERSAPSASPDTSSAPVVEFWSVEPYVTPDVVPPNTGVGVPLAHVAVPSTEDDFVTTSVADWPAPVSAMPGRNVTAPSPRLLITPAGAPAPPSPAATSVVAAGRVGAAGIEPSEVICDSFPLTVFRSV